jgi:hypothetical protein
MATTRDRFAFYILLLILRCLSALGTPLRHEQAMLAEMTSGDSGELPAQGWHDPRINGGRMLDVSTRFVCILNMVNERADVQ